MNSASPSPIELRKRQRILEAAFQLLAESGWSTSLLEDACRASGIELPTAQTFFPRSESIVMAIYLRVIDAVETAVSELPAGGLADRFAAMMRAKLALLAPHKRAFRALLAVGIDQEHELGVLSEQTEWVRDRMSAIVQRLASESSDAPAASPEAWTRLLYALHLAVIFAWIQSAEPTTRQVEPLLDLLTGGLAMALPLSQLPAAEIVLQQVDQALRSFFPPHAAEADSVAREILVRLFRHRRLLPSIAPASQGDAAIEADNKAGRLVAPGNPCPAYCEACARPHLARVKFYVRRQEPIQFLLPAFPAKSPCQQKTLGHLPDMAEEQALLYLDRVAQEVAEAYPPGMEITICSDGHVFGDLVGVSDPHIDEYAAELSAMIARLGLTTVRFFSLSDLYDVSAARDVRQSLEQHYALPLEAIVARAHQHPQHQAQVDGIQRFLFEERILTADGQSRTQVRNACRELAYRVVRRSDAWDRLLRDCFPQACRLSIHPQLPHGEKIGLLLGAAEDAWVTPWHSVALLSRNHWQFVKRAHAESLGARLVSRSGRASHFELSGED